MAANDEPGAVAWPATLGAVGPLRPGIVKQRNAALVVLLMVVTCTLYGYVWLYETTAELRDATGDPSINPVRDLLLYVVTLGIWGFVVEHQNVQRVTALIRRREPAYEDRTTLVLVLNVLALVTCVTGFAASYVVQEQLNHLARLEA